MKKLIILFSLFLYLSQGILATNSATNRKPSKYNIDIPKVFILDNFEDGEILEDPQWWSFGNLKTYVSLIPDSDREAYNERYSLLVKGETQNRVIGGLGRYLGIPGDKYNAIKLLIRSNKENNGYIRFELYDDDNNNAEVEINPDDPKYISYDDRFIHTLPINWLGWKVMIIPLHMFIDFNIGIGDDIFNPYHEDYSGGLLQFQMLFLSNEDKGSVDIEIDSMKLYYDKSIKR